MKLLSLFSVLVLISLSACSMFTESLSVDQRTSVLPIQVASTDAMIKQVDLPANTTLRVLSLNMAHGRKDSFSQLFLGADEIRQNLAEIVEFLKRENADIVTLQEADDPSRWSGNFDHVELIAREAGYAWYTHASHVDNAFGSYGTAVLSRFPITDGYQVDFNPTPPTTRKGFTLAQIELPVPTADGEQQVIDVVSVHLDFSRRSKRIEQVEDMKEVLSQRGNPTIVLGDFNSSWTEGDRELQTLAEVKKLKTHRPDANFLYTYAEERFDWILVSHEFEFCDYYAASDVLSDHLAVISDVELMLENSAQPSCGLL